MTHIFCGSGTVITPLTATSIADGQRIYEATEFIHEESLRR